MRDGLSSNPETAGNTGYRRDASPSATAFATDRVTIDIATPVRWEVEHFWVTHGLRAFGVVIAFCPTTLAIGAEFFGSSQTARGFAVFVGPFWFGIATRLFTLNTPSEADVIAELLAKARDK